MPVLPEDNEKYRQFVLDKITELGCLEFDSEATLWHYTTGQGLLGIIESGEIHATQVACLNDSTEILYATELFKKAIADLREKNLNDADIKSFLDETVRMAEDEPLTPSHSPSKFFVACFTTQEDDLSQWRAYSETGGENGYAIGFRARGLFTGLNSNVVKVNYDREKHQSVATDVAEATLRFYREGLGNKRAATPEEWAKEFFLAWDEWIYKLAPLVKDDCFQAESEFRIVHELHVTEKRMIRFKQKATLLDRHLPLKFPLWSGTRVPLLPIVRIVVGPGRQTAVTRISVNTLLEQFGYRDIPVTVSKRPLQRA